MTIGTIDVFTLRACAPPSHVVASSLYLIPDSLPIETTSFRQMRLLCVLVSCWPLHLRCLALATFVATVEPRESLPLAKDALVTAATCQSQGCGGPRCCGDPGTWGVLTGRLLSFDS